MELNLTWFILTIFTEGLSSTSCELPLSPRSNLYPHGIINPNYPGFQHLAHTLSEEYSAHASNCNLSDCGMYQSNLRVDSKNANEPSSDDNGNPNVDAADEHEHLASPISDSIISSNTEFTNYHHRALLEQCNLQTYLNHYRNKSDIKLYDEELEQMNVVSCTPPDILFFKGHDSEVDNGDGKPDLIQNVRECNTNEKILTTEFDVFGEQVSHGDMNDERNSLPPNIVGDFEKEIEKEIVEIVSGYKDIFGDRTSTQVPHTTTPVKDEPLSPPHASPINHPITAFDKIHDAKLSNGREAITANFEMKPIKLPSMIKRAEVKQIGHVNDDNKYYQLNNNYHHKYAAAATTTTTKYNRAVNSINNNHVDYLQEQQQRQPNKETKHHYNCNFFNAISKNVNRSKTTSSFFKAKEWNNNGKTIIKKKGIENN